MSDPHRNDGDDQGAPGSTGAHAHGHVHGLIDPTIASTDCGLWAVKWSFIGLMLTALLQAAVVAVSGSVALLADTIHNVSDAATAIPLAIAFTLARRQPSRRFPYGLCRVEDLAGIAIVAAILASAIVAAWESVARLLRPQPIEMLWAVMLASVVGSLGNEAVAVFRIRVGRQIGSAALVADGYHARADGLTSLAVLVGALGVWAGFPRADALAGLAISAAILWLVGQSGRMILVRMLDGVEPGTLEAIAHAARHVRQVEDVTDVRARWIGHRLHAEMNITVARGPSLVEAHAIAKDVRHELLHLLPHLGSVIVHVDPAGEGSERHHRISEHEHDGLPVHSHP